MSFFDRQGIVRNIKTEVTRSLRWPLWVKRRTKTKGDSILESTNSNGFESDILTLRNYLFILVNSHKTIFQMHRLVQLATQRWLNAHGQLEKWKRQFIKRLTLKFPAQKDKNRERCQLLFPHAKSAVSLRPEKKRSLREWALLLEKAAWHALESGNMDDAERMLGQVIKTWRKLFGQKYPLTLISIGNLASIYEMQGRWDKAEELEVQVLEVSKRIFGEEH
jgi:hypothetical protein